MIMNIGIYIHELLLENDTVIIPGFGAFVSAYKPAEINEETGELKPPSKEITFNAQIRNNDGLLVGKVADEEGISHFDALKEIEKERENIIYHLDKGEKVTLEDTGVLFYDENHEIQFNPLFDRNLLLDSFGLETISLKEEEENKEEKPVTEADEEEPVPAEEKPEASVEKDTENVKEEDTVSEVEPGGAEKDEPKETETESEQKEETDEMETPPYYVPDDFEYNRKKRYSWLWLLLLLIPVAGVILYLQYRNSGEVVNPDTTYDNSLMIQEEEQAAGTDIALKDSVGLTASDSIQMVVEDTLTAESEPESVEEIIPEGPKYHLIGGSFKDEENAEEYLRELEGKGLKPVLLGKHGSYFIISIGAFDTVEEAARAKKEFETNNPETGVWVLKK